VLENFDFQTTPELGGQVTAVFNRTAPDQGDAQIWISAGGRISYAFHENAQLGIDAGFDTVKVEGADRRNLFKIGIAPAISAGKGYWSRPTLRLFAALGFWNAAARAANVDSGGIYTATDKTFGATFGLQGESWW
jgi:maltoporin